MSEARQDNEDRNKIEVRDLSEAVETVLKIGWILLVAALLLILLFNRYISEGIDFSLYKAEQEHTELLARKAEIEKRIEYLKGKEDTLDPVFDWWFCTFRGREELKKMILMSRYIRLNTLMLARQLEHK